MPHRDCLEQEIKPGARVLWSAHHSHAGFQQGVMRVVSMSEKRVRIENQATGQRSTVDPKAVVVVDKILRNYPADTSSTR